MTEFKDFGAKAEGVLRFVLSSSRWLGDGATFDLDYESSADRLRVTSRFRQEALAPTLRWRFDFWCAVSGGKNLAPATVKKPAQARTGEEGLKLNGLSAKALAAGLKQVATLAGVRAAAQVCSAERPPELVFDARLDGEGAVIVNSVNESVLTLFVPGGHAPAVGDKLQMRLTLSSGANFPIAADITSAVRPPAPKSKLGFTATMRGPPADLVAQLQSIRATALVTDASEQRTHPRVPVIAPVAVRVQEPSEGQQRDVATRPARPAPAPARVHLAYATEAEFSADYVANLSKGGAFIRTRTPLPVETQVLLDISLPRGFSCSTKATVVHVGGGGMGVQFNLDEASETALDAALLHIASPPKRALIVGGRAHVLDGVTTALTRRGYVVVAAPDVNVALRLLLDTPFDVEVLVAEMTEPRTVLERFIDTLRYGGASDLAIALVRDAAAAEGDVAAWAQDHSVDAVLRSSDDADAIADAAVAAARRRVDGAVLQVSARRAT